MSNPTKNTSLIKLQLGFINRMVKYTTLVDYFIPFYGFGNPIFFVVNVKNDFEGKVCEVCEI